MNLGGRQFSVIFFALILLSSPVTASIPSSTFSDTSSMEVDGRIIDTDPPTGAYVDGESVSGEVIVENTGSSDNTYYVGYDVVDPEGENRNNDGTTGTTLTLAPGETETVEVSWSVEGDAPVGTYDVVFALWEESDPDNLNNRLDNEEHNDAFRVEEEEVDGELDFVSHPSGSFASGDTAEAEAEVMNDGNVENTYYVGYSGIDSSGEEWDNDGTTGMTVTLEPGESEVVDVSWEVEDDAPEDQYDSWVALWEEDDPDDLHTRLDEDEEYDAFRVEEEEVDGELSFVEHPDGTYTEGETVEAEAEVTNDGDVENTYYVGYSGIDSSGDEWNNDGTTGTTVTLEPGESEVVDVSWEVEDDVPEDQYDSWVALWEEDDPDNLHTRLDEDEEYDAFRVEEEEVDGELSVVEHPDGAFVEGETVEARTEVTNDGDVENTYYVGYSGIDSSGEEWNNDGTTGTTVTLEPGESEVVDVSWEVEDDAPEDQYDSWVALWEEDDPDDLHTRLDEDEEYDAFRVEEEEVDGELSFVDHPSGSVTAGEAVEAEAEVTNNGDVENTYYVGYSGIDSSGEEWDNGGTTGTTVTLEPGETEVVDVSWEVEDNAPEDSYDSWVALWKEDDPDNLHTRLDEDEESDAFRVEEEEVDGELSFVDHPSGSVTAGEAVEAEAEVTNNGDVENTYYVGYSAIDSSGEEWDNDGTTGTTVTLEPGESEVVDVSWEVEDDAPADEYDSWVALWEEDDPDDLHTRLDEDEEYDAFRVEEEEVDGELSFVEHPDGTYTEGETVEAEAEVTNDGDVENTYYVGYSGIDSSGEEWDNDGTTGTTVTLEPGETEVVDVRWEVEDDAPAGEYDSWVALWEEDDPANLQTRLDEDEVYDAFEITEEHSSAISWSNDPPQDISEDGSFTISAQGQLNDEGELCLLNENEDSVAKTIECRGLSEGEFEESFTVEAADDLTFQEGSSTELSFRLESDGGTEDNWTDARSVSLEGTDVITVRALEEDGGPVSEADVRLEGVGEKTTNDEGEVTFNSEIDSEIRIEVVDGSGHIRESETIDPGEDTVEVEFPNLEPVQGVVLNDEGEPIEEGTSVSIGGTSFEGTTDESGVFEFEYPLPTGNYTLNIGGHEDATLSVKNGVSTYELETHKKTELVKDREKTFVKGAVCGDPCWNSKSYDEEHNLSYLVGWIGASVAPVAGQFADSRDLGSALARGSETDAALSALGILSGPAAAPKAAKVTRKFLSRYPSQTQRVGKLVLESDHIPDAVFHRAVYRGAPDSIEEVDNEVLIRYIDEGGDIDPVTRHLDKGVDPDTINKLADEGADLGKIRVGKKVTGADVDVVKQEVSISEVQMLAKAKNGENVRYLDNPTWDNHIVPKHISGKDANPGTDLFPTGQSGTPSRMTEKDVKDLIYKGMRQQPEDGRVVMDSSDYPELSDYGIDKMRVIVYDEGNVATAYPTEGEAVKTLSETS
ncbi:hypothetical protein [Halosimplex sp. TS25]|uniref:hypothetical protein n=1 Tax=Halosimplex rarum TaxID=3396619 RepID=UPI0039EB3C54